MNENFLKYLSPKVQVGSLKWTNDQRKARLKITVVRKQF